MHQLYHRRVNLSIQVLTGALGLGYPYVSKGRERGPYTKMKTVKDKQILMAADFAGYPLKEAIKEYLEGFSSVPLMCKR